MKKIIYFTIISLFFSLNLSAENIIRAGSFSNGTINAKIPINWEPFDFEYMEKHTEYKLVKYEDRVVLKAVANKSASGLKRKIEIDLKEYPIIEWSWNIQNIYKNADVKKKTRDDYPARIYIAFKYDPDNVGFFERARFKALKTIHGEYPPLSLINYIFESREPVGTIVPNAYTERVQMFVVNSGKKDTNKWIRHSRNVYDDYKIAFGKIPPLVSGIAIMTDSDNTGEKASAYYGDIIFRKKIMANSCPLSQ